MQLILNLGAVDQKLLGHTTTDHTGAADPVSLHNRHPGTVASRTLCGSQSSGTGTHHNQVKAVVVQHSERGEPLPTARIVPGTKGVGVATGGNQAMQRQRYGGSALMQTHANPEITA